MQMSKSDGERQMLYNFIHMWNKICGHKLQIGVYLLETGGKTVNGVNCTVTEENKSFTVSML